MLLQKGLKNLDGVNLLGVVMNDSPAAERHYYQQYYSRNQRNRDFKKS